MKNKYDEIRPVMSVTDIRDLVESKGLIMVKGWKKPVSASFIGVMPEHTIEKYVKEERMHVVQIVPRSNGIKWEKLEKPSLWDRFINWCKS